MTLGLLNANPVVHAKKERVARTDDTQPAASTSAAGAVDPLDVYDHVRDIRDPEHPYSLEQLSVLSEESITVDDRLGRILRFLQFKGKPAASGSSPIPPWQGSRGTVNKQLNDKERVAAALENPNLRQLVDECLASNEL